MYARITLFYWQKKIEYSKFNIWPLKKDYVIQLLQKIIWARNGGDGLKLGSGYYNTKNRLAMDEIVGQFILCSISP